MSDNSLKILIPSNNLPERQYIISVLLKDILGIKYHLEIASEIDYTLLVWKNKNIIIQDSLWNNNKIDKSYLKVENIPLIIKFAKAEGILGLPIIYGNDFYFETNTTIKCGVDIFASAFFLLTRWEESLLGREDTGKCNEFDLLCVRNNCTKRAIVNEYLEFLKSIFNKFGINFNAANFQKTMVTHDVDRCYLSSFAELLNNLFKLAFYDKQYLKAFVAFKNYLTYKIKRQTPFNSFDELMDYSDSVGVISSFYFKASLYKESGWTYSLDDNIVNDAIKRILKRGHKIGLHPTELTFNNNIRLKEEYERLKDIISTLTIEGARTHCLQFNSNTMKQYAQFFRYDTSFGYQHFNGFRCGICYPFRMFDVFSQTKLRIYEIPFVAMDTVALRNQWNAEEMYKDVSCVIDVVHKFNGTICINWHTNLINTIENKKYKKVYLDILKYIYTKNER